MEAKFPGVKVFLACKDSYLYLLQGEQRIVGEAQLKANKNEYAYIRELTCDMKSHPVEAFMNESEIPCGPIIEKLHENYHSPVLIFSEALSPTRSLTPAQVEKVVEFTKGKGGNLVKINPKNNFDGRWAIGVECEELFRAGAMGLRVTLIPTGFGENLFKKMFPSGEIFRLEG